MNVACARKADCGASLPPEDVSKTPGRDFLLTSLFCTTLSCFSANLLSLEKSAMPLVVHRQKHCHGIWITSCHSRSHVFLFSSGGRKQENTCKGLWLRCKDMLPIPFFSRLLISFLTLGRGGVTRRAEFLMINYPLVKLSTPPNSCR